MEDEDEDELRPRPESSNGLVFVPRDRQDVKDVGWVTYEIFPGGITPRLEEIIAAVNPYWEVLEVKTRRLDYMKTTWHWRDRLRRLPRSVQSGCSSFSAQWDQLISSGKSSLARAWRRVPAGGPR